MSANGKYNPYVYPTPYDVLGLKKGLKATAAEIGRSYNDAIRKARRLRDLKERTKRIKELDGAKAQLLKPEDRVLMDFFLLGNDVFVDLCQSYAQKLAGAELPVAKIIGPLYPKRRYDDLVPEALDKVVSEFPLIETPDFHDEPRDLPRLQVAWIDL
jgi:hypothetical protein